MVYFTESYGSYTTLTVTSLSGLASSITAGWRSPLVDNQSSVKALDYEIFIKMPMANTAPASDKAVYAYICPAITTDGGTTWLLSDQGTTTLPTTSEGATTLSSQNNNLYRLGTLTYPTSNMVLQKHFLLSKAIGLGSHMPDGFGIILVNFTGAAVSSSSGCVVAYRAINVASS